MNEKITYADLKKVIRAKGNATNREVTTFLAAFNKAFLQALQEDGSARINGLGTFSRKTVAARRSVNVSTGEDITIDSYNKIAFAAEVSFRESIDVAPIQEEVKQAISEITDPIRKIGEQATEIMDIIHDINSMDAQPSDKTENQSEKQPEHDTELEKNNDTIDTEKEQVVEQSPFLEEIPAGVESAVSETPQTVVVEPAEEETPVVDDAPVQEESTVEETPAEEEEPVVEEEPAEEEEPIAEEAPAEEPEFKSPNVEKVEQIEEKVAEIKEEVRENIDQARQEAKKKAKKVKNKGVDHPWIAAIVTILVFIALLASLFLFIGYKFEKWVGEVHERTSVRNTQVLRSADPAPSQTTVPSDEFADSAKDTSLNTTEPIIEGNATEPVAEGTTTDPTAEDKPTEPVTEDNTTKTVVESNVAETVAENIAEPIGPVFKMPRFNETLGTEVIGQGTYLSTFARKYYGKQNTDLWVFIFEANRGKARNPDCIKRGTELTIPKLSKEWLDLSNPQTRFTVDSLLHKYNKTRAN